MSTASADDLKFGGGGHAAVGTLIGAYGTDEVSPLGGTIGGGGYMMIKPFVFAGKGYLVAQPGSVSAVGGGGGLSFGPEVLNSNHKILYPSVGFQGLTVARVDAESSFDPATTNFVLIEFAATYLVALNKDNPSSAQVGVELGVQRHINAPRWDGEIAINLEDPRLSSAFARFLIGGGGFSRK